MAPSETRLWTVLESARLLFHSEGQLLQRVLTVELMSATQMVNPVAQAYNGLRPLIFKNKYVFAELRSVSTGKSLQEYPHVI